MNVIVAEPPPAVCMVDHSLSISQTTAGRAVAHSSVTTVVVPATAVIRPTCASTRVLGAQMILPLASTHFQTSSPVQLPHLRYSVAVTPQSPSVLLAVPSAQKYDVSTPPIVPAHTG